jgi:hypothetical protein
MSTESDTPRTDRAGEDGLYSTMVIHALRLERELNEVTKQRNALTEALIAAQGALNPLSGFTKIKDNRYLQIVRDKVREALETTK